MEFLVMLLVGAIAGWLGSVIFKGSGLGLVGNIIVGLLGGLVGGWLLGKLGLNIGVDGIPGAILQGAIGAIVILLILNLIFGRRA